MTEVFYADAEGHFLYGWIGENPEPPPAGAIEVPSAPDDVRQIWNGTIWEPLTVQKYKIYDYVAGDSFDRERLPVDIDFKTGLTQDLFKEVTMSGGAPVYKKYYSGAVMNQDGSITYSNPIVKIDYTFERDAISLAKSCTQKIYWYDTTGAPSVQYKEVKDFFSYAESIAEAELRRSNIINDLKVKTIGLLMITEEITQADAAELGRVFLAAHKVEIYNYIDEANSAFYDAVTAASGVTYPWLDNMTPYSVTIRQFILNGIS